MEILQKINWVDVLVLILCLRISYVAFQEGLSHEIFPLIGSVLVVVLSLHYYQPAALLISRNIFGMPIEFSGFLSFLALAVTASIIVRLVKSVLDKIVRVEWHPILEKFGGLLIGVVRAAITASLVLIILALAPLPYFQWSIRDKSVTGMYFLRIGPAVYAKVSRFLPVVKLEGASADKEAIVKNLAADKSVAPVKSSPR